MPPNPSAAPAVYIRKTIIMRKIIYTLSLFILCFTALNCQKEVSYTSAAGENNQPITATIQGNVIDENNQAASLVTITVGNKTTITDDKGYFRIENAALNKSAAMVTASRQGYFKTYRVFNASKFVNQINFKLIKKELTGTFNSGAGGLVSLANGSSITYQANSLVKKTGGSYSGQVNIYAAYIDPTLDDIGQKVPGSFLANDKENKRVLLTSYAMMVVEMESAAGEKLQLSNSASALMKFAIPAGLQATAPATMPLWYVDEVTGIWKEEGSALKNGNYYTGTVNHFTYWNCDVPGAKVNFTAKIVNQNGLPLSFVDVTIRPVGGYASAHGLTDSLGIASGPIPANINLVLEVRAPYPCYGVIFTQNIGPYSSNVNLGTLTINNQQTLITLQGNLVNCAGSPVTNGFATVNYNNLIRHINADASGHFTSSFLTCGTNTNSLTVMGTDVSAQQQSAPVSVTITAPQTNAGNISACGTSSIEFVNYQVDDTTTNISSTVPNDNFMAIDSSFNGGNNNLTIQGFRNYSRQLTFVFNNSNAAGSFPISYLYVNNFGTVTPVLPLNINLTKYAAASGEFYEGNFTGQFKDAANVTHSITCSFKVKRN